jgi:hypothetical protein
MEYNMGKVIRGPWTYKTFQNVCREGYSGGYKILDYFTATERQEMALKSNVFMVLYIMNSDYNTTFLVPGTEEEVRYQINYRKDNPDELQKIKNSFSIYF